MTDRIKVAGTALALAAALGALGLVTWGNGSAAAAAPAPAVQAAAQAAPAADRRPVDCTKQAWPYVAPECLSAPNGTPVRKVSRIVTAQ